MSSDANTIASLVRRMENQKLLLRSTDPKDRRIRRLQLTPKGEAKFDELRRIALHLQDDMLQDLPPKDRDAFLHQLEIVAQNCQRASENQIKDKAKE
jgi:DNA-binding MarR family transcriptional regulator